MIDPIAAAETVTAVTVEEATSAATKVRAAGEVTVPVVIKADRTRASYSWKCPKSFTPTPSR